MINPAWAQVGQGSAPSALMNLMPLVLIFVVFYFLLIRPQQQKTKEHAKMLANLKRNDDVITAGGLYGKVVQIGDRDRVVTLEIAPNVRVKVDRPQIASLVNAPKTGQGNGAKEKDATK